MWRYPLTEPMPIAHPRWGDRGIVPSACERRAKYYERNRTQARTRAKRDRKYRQTPEYRERRWERERTPEYRERQRERDRKRRATSEYRERRREKYRAQKQAKK